MCVYRYTCNIRYPLAWNVSDKDQIHWVMGIICVCTDTHAIFDTLLHGMFLTRIKVIGSWGKLEKI